MKKGSCPFNNTKDKNFDVGDFGIEDLSEEEMRKVCDLYGVKIKISA